MEFTKMYKAGDAKKDFEMYLNACSPEEDSEKWIIGGKNRYCNRNNYGTMLKRYDKNAFEIGYREWKENK